MSTNPVHLPKNSLMLLDGFKRKKSNTRGYQPKVMLDAANFWNKGMVMGNKEEKKKSG